MERDFTCIKNLWLSSSIFKPLYFTRSMAPLNLSAYLCHAIKLGITGVDLSYCTLRRDISVWNLFHCVGLLHLVPYVSINNWTLAMYASLASSCDSPFFSFHASHFALPLKSRSPPGLAGSRRNKSQMRWITNTSKYFSVKNEGIGYVWKPPQIYFTRSISTMWLKQCLSRCSG
jgi:hypothetical protein